MSTTTRRPLGPDEGERVRLLALGVRFMIDGDSTGGAFSLVEHPLAAARARVTTAHAPQRGRVLVRAQGAPRRAARRRDARGGPGELVFKPHGVPHAFWNAGDEPLRLLELISPAGFENYFRELAPLLAERTAGQAAIGEVAGSYELEIDFGTIPVLAERHGLRLK